MFNGGKVVNSTIVRNSSSKLGAGCFGATETGSLIIINCVVWGNRWNSSVSNLSGSIGCSYSAVEGGFSGSSNVINLSSYNYGTEVGVNYPWFVSPDDGDYRLRKESCLINAGNTYMYLPNTDISGTVRVIDDIVDIGCYEFTDEGYCVFPLFLTVKDITGSSVMLTWERPDLNVFPFYELSYKLSDAT